MTLERESRRFYWVFWIWRGVQRRFIVFSQSIGFHVGANRQRCIDLRGQALPLAARPQWPRGCALVLLAGRSTVCLGRCRDTSPGWWQAWADSRMANSGFSRTGEGLIDGKGNDAEHQMRHDLSSLRESK